MTDELKIQVMDELYFLTAWAELLEKTNLSEFELKEALHSLIDEEMVDQLIYEERHKSFVRVIPTNVDSFSNSSFLNTRKGLLWLHV